VRFNVRRYITRINWFLCSMRLRLTRWLWRRAGEWCCPVRFIGLLLLAGGFAIIQQVCEKHI